MKIVRKFILGSTLFFFYYENSKSVVTFFIFLTFHQTPVLVVNSRIFYFSIKQVQNNVTNRLIDKKDYFK